MHVHDPFGHHHHDHDHDHDHDHGATTLAEYPRDPATESLIAALRSSFNVLRVVIVALVIAYFASGFFKVNQGEQGLIVRFGELHERAGSPVLGPGFYGAWPDPFDEKIRIPGALKTIEIDSFLFERAEDQKGRPITEVMPVSPQLRPGLDGAMLTGDKNLSHGLWVIEYRIGDAEKFVQNVGETDAALQPLLRRLTEHAIVRAVAYRRVEDVTRTARAAVAADVRSKLQAALEQLETGIVVENVRPNTIEPVPVRQAFTAVTQAQADSARDIDVARQRAAELKNRAAGPAHERLLAAVEAYGAAQAAKAEEVRLEELRREIDAALQEAGGEVAGALASAQAQANKFGSDARREYSEFSSQLELFRRDPVLTTTRLWQQMRGDVLGSKQNEVFYLPSSGAIEILTNRDPAKLLEAEQERYRRQQGGPR